MEYPNDPLINIYWKREYQEPLSTEEEATWQQWQSKHPVKDKWAYVEEELLLYSKFKLEEEAAMVHFREAFREAYPVTTIDREAKRPWYKTVFVEYGMAAAVLLLAASLVFFYLVFQRARGKQPVAFTNQLNTGVQPEDSQVAIILANGKRQFMEETGDEIPLQGAFRVKMINGQLVYERTLDGHGNAADSFNIVQVPAGKQLIVKMPDGSVTTLNATTCVKIPLQVNSATRNVALLGEASFEVQKDKSRPFWVHAEDIAVKAIGTKFTVIAYKGQENKTVILQEGKIIISNGKEARFCDKPLVYNVNSRYVGLLTTDPIRNANLIQEARAREAGMFYYKEATLAEIVPELERWYDVQLVNRDILAMPGHFHIDSTLRTVPLKVVAENLEQTKAVSVIIDGKRIIIKKNR